MTRSVSPLREFGPFLCRSPLSFSPPPLPYPLLAPRLAVTSRSLALLRASYERLHASAKPAEGPLRSQRAQLSTLLPRADGSPSALGTLHAFEAASYRKSEAGSPAGDAPPAPSEWACGEVLASIGGLSFLGYGHPAAGAYARAKGAEGAVWPTAQPSCVCVCGCVRGHV